MRIKEDYFLWLHTQINTNIHVHTLKYIQRLKCFFFHCWVINSLDHSHALVRVAAKLGLPACCTCQKSMCHGDSLTVMKESVWCGNHCSRTDELMTCFSFCSYYQDTSPLPQHLEPLGRSKEESEKNSWVYKFSLRQPSAGSSSPHTHT